MSGVRRRGKILALFAALSVSSALVGVSTAHAGPPRQNEPSANEFEVTTLSTEPEYVTGGEVLVAIAVPPTVPAHQVHVSVDGRDISDAFAPAPEDPRRLVGLVEGLSVGKNTLQVRADGRGNGRPTATMELTNHPITGPVFSGPHQEPFLCETEAFGLGPPLDDDCSAETKVEYFYLSSATEAFEPFDPAGPRPDDLARTTTIEGDTVDSIVRRETGTINRAVYEIAFLHSPGEPAPDPWTSTPGWNGRLVYTFGGGCNAGFHQGASTGGVLNADLLEPGFAVASSSQNVFGNRCNDVTSAETAMMVKEHFIESFGAEDYTIGYGCSGGAMQVHLVAQNYPGILDGIIPLCSYADVASLIGPASDCGLLERAFAASEQPWSPEQMTAVSGFGTWDVCPEEWSAPRETFSGVGFEIGYILPQSCNPAIPEELIYDPVTNPDGVRCTLQDDWINVLGTDPGTGFAPGLLDNVGVQYGLEALNQGVISFEQFVEFNELVGGFDIDANYVAERTVADAQALELAYATGRVNSGGGGLATLPIIDLRSYTDLNPDIHDFVRSFSVRERLIEANGHADNQVIWVEEGPSVLPSRAPEAVRVMDEWLRAITADTSAASAAEKVVQNKPDEAVDTCWTPYDWKIVQPIPYEGSGVCGELYPAHADPRIAAGAPVADDIIKCALKPVEAADYVESLTEGQLDRLREVFPQGVCNYEVPGIGEQPLEDTWLDYSRSGA
ncbi:DUF6351 family protein [Blastococcus sp. VKM Ac-2987]|uniref:DUF6351 family protein n=1 Tax=Blastococcus sp. VKM Ac-2987 TaxID=3004141 RepID=UPI0022AB9B58|nr:DUF6351 family protein [Blastococcus sp. VKM Ac-2987]MCZ2859830.1 DUF6351 family protein [Blastococcus sp. VKM Ac-2987]